MTTIKYINTIHIMSGVPGSGKSTFIKEHATEGDIILCRDAWRDKWREAMRKLAGIDDYFPFDRQQEYKLWSAYVDEHIAVAPKFGDIWIDQTSCSLGALIKILKVISAAINKLPTNRDYDILIHIMETPYEECIRRNELREGNAKVPDIIIDRMWDSRKFSYKAVRKTVPELCIDFDHIGADGNVVKVLEA